MAENRGLSENVKTIRALAPAAAGTTTLESAEVDTLGFEGIRYIVSFGAISASSVTDARWEDSDTTGTGYNDVAGSSQPVTVTTDNGSLVIGQVYKPKKRFMKLKVVRATANAVVDLGIVELFRANQDPVTQDSSVSHHKEQASPIDGTA